MLVSRLSLTDFRNHRDARIDIGPGFVVLSGENGAGKTNVLEALSLLAPGRGLRGATLGEMARRDGPGGFAVAADLARLPPLPFKGGDQGVGGERSEPFVPDTNRSGIEPDRMVTHPNPSLEREGRIGTGTIPTAPERRQVRINGATASATSLAEWLAVLWLTPAMDRLFSEAASGRRRFLDRLVLALEPGHASHAARYEAAMRARNKLLADPDSADPAWLAALEAGMVEHGAAMAQARERTIATLARQLAEQTEGPFARAAVALDRWRPAEADAAAALAEQLRRGRGADAGAGRALAGPHRTDLLVSHVGKRQPAGQCSTGEQKALLLGLVLAHAELVAARAGRSPILLLDEVAAHLDPRRREALFERLRGWGGQVWMTGTEASLFSTVGADATWFAVDDGAVRKSE